MELPALSSALRAILLFLQGAARIVGYIIAFGGWFVFWLNLYFLVFSEAEGVGESLEACGPAIVIAWLLLRFAAGLFPFGRRFSRQIVSDDGWL